MKKLTTLFLSLVLVMTAMVFVPLTAQASDPVREETCSDAGDLQSRLDSSGNKWIKLTKNMSVNWDSTDGSRWATIHGKKVLDLNGYHLTVTNSKAKTSTLITVAPDAELTILDSGKDGSIEFKGYIDGDGNLQWRDLFQVQGTLTVNGGTLAVGQSVRNYSAYYAKYVYRQIYGNTVVVSENGNCVINDGTLYGRGSRESAVYLATKASHLTINGGVFHAKGGANCLEGILTGSTVTVRGGHFTCETLGAIKVNGKTTKGYEVGSSNVSSSMYDPNAVTVSGSSTNQTFKPNVYQKVNHALKSTGVVDGTTITLTPEKCQIISTYDHTNCYWPLYQPGSYGHIGNNHKFIYRWNIYNDKGEKISTAYNSGDGIYVGTANSSIDVMKHFNSFKPEKGVRYLITCEAFEYLGESAVKSYSRTYDFKMVDDINAPSFVKQPPETLTFENGGSVTINAEVKGTNLAYCWQVYYPSVGSWMDMSESAVDYTSGPTLKLNDLSKADDGIQYRLRASNSAGTSYSSGCTLKMKNSTVNPVITDLDMPMHNEPLDITALVSTPGCRVTDVQWHTLKYSTLPADYIPYAGQTVFCDIIVEAEEGFNLGTASIDGWSSGKLASTSYPAVNSKRYSFMVDVVAPEGGVLIKEATLDMKEPTVGTYLPSAWPSNMGYDDTMSPDVRYNTSGGTIWYLDGKQITVLDEAYNVKEGNVYKAEVLLKGTNGYFFNETSKVLLNGEYLKTKLEGRNLRVIMEYDYTPETYVFPFTDVAPTSWYYDWVVQAHKLGLIDGMSPTKFEPDGNMTYAQAITLAARMNQKYTTGSVTLENGTVNWYDTYVEYCLSKGIIDSNYSTVINNKIDRSSYVHIFANALPDSALKEKNYIPDNIIPDVKMDSPYAADIYKMYRAGILNGSDPKGTFNPSSNIKRSEVAAILVRMMDASARVSPPSELGS